MTAGVPGRARFPAMVPVLADPLRGVRLRAHEEADLRAIVEQARDPVSVRFTTVPTPYGLDDARSFLTDVVVPGWESGRRQTWALEADLGEGPACCGSIDLRLTENATAEVGFGLHPAARGRGLMSAALRLVRDHALDTVRLRLLRWRAVVGNWGSRRVAAAAGFRFDGTVRRLLDHRGELLDGWVATLAAEDPRRSLRWLEPPVLAGERVVLRPLDERDLDRTVETCNDERTRYWLVSLPRPYERRHAEQFLELNREMIAQGTGLRWAVSDPADDRCLGTVSIDGYSGYARRAEIGYWAHPEARGRGVITEAVRLVTGYAEHSRLAAFIQIRCAAGNLASRHVAEAAGYDLVGTLPRAEPLADGTVDDLLVFARAQGVTGPSSNVGPLFGAV